MSRTFEELLSEAARLPEQDCATLAGFLIESLEGPSDPDVDALWAAEIERRVADIDSGRKAAIPWEEVRQRLLSGLTAGRAIARVPAAPGRAPALRLR